MYLEKNNKPWKKNLFGNEREGVNAWNYLARLEAVHPVRTGLKPARAYM